MPMFVTIGYGDQAGYDRTPLSARDAAHDQDRRLVDAGATMGIAGSPVQIRNHGALKIETTEGPFMKSSLPVAGFALIEADSLEAAIALVAKTPCAVADGVVEVWPLVEQSN